MHSSYDPNNGGLISDLPQTLYLPSSSSSFAPTLRNSSTQPIDERGGVTIEQNTNGLTSIKTIQDNVFITTRSKTRIPKSQFETFIKEILGDTLNEFKETIDNQRQQIDALTQIIQCQQAQIETLKHNVANLQLDANVQIDGQTHSPFIPNKKIRPSSSYPVFFNHQPSGDEPSHQTTHLPYGQTGIISRSTSQPDSHFDKEEIDYLSQYPAGDYTPSSTQSQPR